MAKTHIKDTFLERRQRKLRKLQRHKFINTALKIVKDIP